MLACPILALVREPVIRRGVDALTLVPLEELVHIRDPHRAADDLADAGHEQVAALREDELAAAGVAGPLLHVESLEPRGEAVQEDGRADGIRHLALRCLRDVVADRVWHHLWLPLRVCDHVAVRVFSLVQDAVFVQPCDSVDVG